MALIGSLSVSQVIHCPRRHCEERSDEASQKNRIERIASLRSQ
jgi:hypothetical protein